ncbi:hypothetical protein [Sediminibacterium soli]|uniref:hypothetical protein n=1 Tax=Sediminibacterium soli TaxID=2698829 RepID=UPI00137A1674|nr:hypothetical protein [Sediminibacterium soli]NCI47243.1 hypothetical protein [Sediminibacterium soli]
MQNNHQPLEKDFPDKVLRSVDGIQRAEAPAFLYTRVMAGMAKSGMTRVSWLVKPAFSFAVLALLLLVNLFAFTKFQDKSEPEPAGSGMQYFADEYALTGTVYTAKTKTHE